MPAEPQSPAPEPPGMSPRRPRATAAEKAALRADLRRDMAARNGGFLTSDDLALIDGIVATAGPRGSLRDIKAPL